MKCTGCNIEGQEGPTLMFGDDPFDKISEFIDNDGEGPVLFAVGGANYCYTCQCKVENKCYQCDENVNTLHRDGRCRTGSYVCAECLVKPATNHLWLCYANGCYTPGEVAQEEWEIMKADGVL